MPQSLCKVLIVEDQPLTRESLAKYLRIKGFHVITSTNGEEAISLTLRDHPDIILMDLGLPGMSGIEAAQIIKQDTRVSETPIIAVTGRPANEWEKASRSAGISLYIMKPVLPSEIVKAITQLLASTPAGAAATTPETKIA